MVTLPSSVVVIRYSAGLGRGFVHMYRCVLESLRVGLVGFHMVGSVTMDIIISFIPFLDSYHLMVSCFFHSLVISTHVVYYKFDSLK